MFTRSLLAAVALTLAPSLALAQKTQETAAGIRLKIGMAAPALTVEKWIKGTPVSAFEKGKVYVVEFWATWCPPCIASMPHLSALQREYGDHGVTLIGVTSADKKNTLQKVETMVGEKGDVMGYTVAWDKARTTYAAFMEAAGQGGIPTSFVVDKAGTIAYIGHPMFLDEPVAEVLAGTWDLAKDPAQLEADQETFFGFYATAESNPKGTLTRLAVFEKTHPKLGAITDPLRFTAELASADFTGAYATAARIVERAIAARDSEQLNEVARTIVDPAQKIAQRDLDLALRAAEKAVEFTGSKNASLLDTLARVHFTKGDYQKAMMLQTMAVSAAPEKQKAGLMKTFEEYKAKSTQQ